MGTEHEAPGERTSLPTVRPAVVSDADAMGTLHVRAWQAGYRGLMPDDYLDGLSIDDRRGMWRRMLSGARDDAIDLVAEIDGAIVGMASAGAAREDDEAGCGELYALNVEPDAWGRGAGRALLAAVTAWLEVRFDSLVLWVVIGNERAERFYAAAGWRPDGAQKTQTLLGVTVEEVRYRRAPGRSERRSSLR